jgi:alpha-amylase
MLRKLGFYSLLGIAALLSPSLALANQQPTAIFHAFNENYKDIENYACKLAEQGYSHLQISPPQKSNPSPEWWARYQPVEYGVIEGKGSKQDLQNLINKAHGCGIKVIADVVLNHMANMNEFRNLNNFPEFDGVDFHSRCSINYSDGNTTTEQKCWLGGDLPDLKSERLNVREIHKRHLKTLVDMGIDGFRFDAAKHIEERYVKDYINYVNQISQGKTWNYLEVIEDKDTRGESYNQIAAITDFRLCNTMLGAFSGGDLRSLKVPNALNDPRSVTFGRNHDTAPDINSEPPSCKYDDAGNAHLATAYVLARESGTPLILGKDNLNVRFIKSGVKFRQIIKERGQAERNVKENVLGVVNSRDVLIMERGNEGFVVVNKGAAFNTPVLDMTLTNVEGCYRELTNEFTVAIEKRGDKKFVTRWGTWKRGGLEIYGREALFFIREPWQVCLSS